MQFTRVEEAAEEITVETTGARYVFYTDGGGRTGRILCTQLINGVRQVAQIDLGVSFEHLTLESPNVTEAADDLHATCVLNAIPVESSCAFIRVEIHPDSLLELYSTSPVDVTISSGLAARYHADTQGHLLLIDELGGIGMYPYSGHRNRDLTHIWGPQAPEWNVRYQLDRDSHPRSQTVRRGRTDPHRSDRPPAGHEGRSLHKPLLRIRTQRRVLAEGGGSTRPIQHGWAVLRRYLVRHHGII